MGRPKRKQRPQAVAVRRVDRETPIDDRAVEALLAVYGEVNGNGNGNGNPAIGISYAVVAGTAFWTIVGLIVVLLF